jgi:dTMP kinase
LHEDAGGAFVEWVRTLEVDRFGVPVPDIQLLLRVPVTVAAARTDGRAAGDSARAKDLYETDTGLQARCAAVYDGLAASSWLAPWWVIDGSAATAATGTTGLNPIDVAARLWEASRAVPPWSP